MDQFFRPPWEKPPEISIKPEALVSEAPPTEDAFTKPEDTRPEDLTKKAPLVMRSGDLTEDLKKTFRLHIPWQNRVKPGKPKKLSEEDPNVYEFRRIPGKRSVPKKGRPPSDEEKRRIQRKTLQNLTPKMLDRRNKFIAEYIKDWCGPAAVIRAGGAHSTAAKMSCEYLREPYVAKRIWEYIDAAAEAELINRKRVLAMLVREANYAAVGASHGARVAALGKLATVLGMDQVNVNVKGEVNHNVRGGVMLVPVVPNSDEWELMASGSQKLLKEDVRR